MRRRGGRGSWVGGEGSGVEGGGQEGWGRRVGEDPEWEGTEGDSGSGFLHHPAGQQHIGGSASCHKCGHSVW